MPRPADDSTTAALDDVAYLARSANRVDVLDTLADGPASRYELEIATGVARATVGRTLGDFCEAGWADRRPDGSYDLTPVGNRVRDEFVPLVERMAVLRSLGEMVGWLPSDEVPIDLGEFADATVHEADEADPLALATHATRLLESAAEFSCLVGVVPPVAFERLLRDGAVEGRLATTHVITAKEYEYIRTTPERATRWRTYVEAGGDVSCYAGEIPCSLLVFDDTVLVGRGPNEDDHAGAYIESEAGAVRRWARRVVDCYRREAEPLDSDDFTESPVES